MTETSDRTPPPRKSAPAPIDIRESLSTLSILQQAEIEIAKLEKSLAEVDANIAALNREVITLEKQVTEAHGNVDALKRKSRESEGEVKTIESRIVQRNEQLRSVKTNKEYQLMLKEIEEMSAKRSSLEDQALASLEEIEKAEQQVNIAKKDLADLQRETADRQTEILKAAEVQRDALSQLELRRDNIMSKLSPHLQKLFERAKKQGRGIGVAPVIDAVCQICRMNIPPQMYNELLRLDSLKTCPNCQRIIFPKALIDES